MIFIPGNVPSSKNSKRFVKTKNGKPKLIHSEVSMRYIKETEWNYIAGKKIFQNMVKGLPKPYYVSFKFIRDSRRKFDYVNPAQTVQDLMVKHGWLEDDNCEILIPVFEPYEYDKENPGVIISLCKLRSKTTKKESKDI